MLDLYHHGSSVCAAKVRLVLCEKSIEWTGHYVDILAGEQFAPGFLRINPAAAVPVIVHDGQVLTESTIICEYLDDRFDGLALKPGTPMGDARMRGWTRRVDTDIHPATRPLTYVITHRHSIMQRGAQAVREHIDADPNPVWRERKRRWIEDGFAAADFIAALRVFVDVLETMETTLAEQEWLAGERYTLADGAITPYANRLEMLGLGELWADKPQVTRWFDAVKARASFAPALFDYLPAKLRERMETDGRRALPEVRAAIERL